MKTRVIFPLLVALSIVGVNCGNKDTVSQFAYRGDYIVGGLFSFHAAGADVTSQSTPMAEICSSFDVSLAGYRNSLVMRFALEEINNNTELLSNVTLGYEIFDTCYIYNIIHPTLDFLSRGDVFNTEETYFDSTPKVISVIGPDSSDAAETTADLFNLLLIPQVNFFATSKRLSDRSLPSCFQTIPSSKMQQQAIIDILTFFNWTWIAVLGSSDDYGSKGMHDLLQAVSDLNICVAYKGIIPATISGKEQEWKSAILQAVNNITAANVNVIVIFSLDVILLDFFKEVVKLNTPGKVWIATETWSAAKNIYNIPNMHRLGVVLGIAAKDVKIPGIEEYLLDAHYQSNASSVAKDVEGTCNQNCQSCLNTTESVLLDLSRERVSFSVYAAVYAVAHALHDVLGCNEMYCNKKTVHPWQVTEALGKVNFTLLGNQIYFDQYGDSPTGYDIVFWDWWGPTPFENIGSYTELGNLTINPEKIKWGTEKNMVPSSVCSPECLPGEEKKPEGNFKCCFICVSCVAGTYLHENGTCVNCKKGQWSTERSTTCFDKTRVYLTWESNLTIALFVMTLLGMLLTAVVIVTFIVHLQSPVVKAAGGKRCFLMLPALTLAYFSILAYLGEPSTLKCTMRHPIYSIALTVCFSYISVRSFQIVCIFKMASKLPATYDYWVKQNGQYVSLAVLSGIQVLISCVWIFTDPPTASIKDLSSDKVLVDCSQFGSVFNIIQYSYNAFLSLLCFTFAYMGKELPKNYNEAKCITFAMLIYFVVCISFFTAQIIDVGELVTPTNAALALVSLLGITGGYFFPKCYIIYCKPQFNTTKYFQSTIQSYTKRGSGSAK
ncbi:taste receptor type 1 member 2 [Spea bombifrons]|uniref:taste receptor type 1 member 2 n=1 Tax=Spea bombifrons TaxID=233779 RepID=UPI002349045C|nr:taste receptor type 1 member 2 [Spea bombifrons]